MSFILTKNRLVIEASPMTNSLTSAASRFHITPRELQVLELLFDGTQLEEIGVRLHIASSTVQDTSAIWWKHDEP